MRLKPSRTNWALALVLLTAAAHAAAHAIVRPAFQISDEIAYFAAAQQWAIDRESPGDASLQRCVAAPAGAPLYDDPSGKAAFRAVAGPLLRASCTHRRPGEALLLMRLAMGLTVPLTVLAAFLLARELFPRPRSLALACALLVGQHPVLVGYGASVSPDALANALAAFGVWLLVRFASGRSHGWEVGILVAVSALAAATKDSALFLLPAIMVASVGRWVAGEGASSTPGRPSADLQPIVVAAAVVVLGIAAATQPAVISPYLPLVGNVPPDALARGVGMLADNLWTQIWSYWASLANFGASDPAPPVAFTWLIVSIAGIGLSLAACGHGWRHSTENRPSRTALAVLVVAFVLLAVQPVMRNVLLETDDRLQGRWLFPMAAPIAAVTCAGWARFGTRSLWLVAAVMTVYAWTALLGTIIPVFYEEFPASYRWSNLYLLGPYGAPTPAEWVSLYVERPAWAMSSRVWWLVASWIAASSIAVGLGLTCRDVAGDKACPEAL